MVLHRAFDVRPLTADPEGRLVVPWAPRWRVHLRLESDGSRLVAGDRELLLPWDDHVTEPTSVRPGWRLTVLPASNSSFGAVTVSARGPLAAAIGALRRTAGASRCGLFAGSDAVLLRRGVDNRRLGLLPALLMFLRGRPDVRPSVNEVRRVIVLVGDLASATDASRPGRHGLRRRDRTDVQVALELLGHRHCHGRPFPGDPLPEATTLVDAVMAHLAQNPYRRGRSAGRHEVEAYVRAHYLDVEPWPFSALLP